MNNLSQDQLEQIHREGVTNVIFNPKHGVLTQENNKDNRTNFNSKNDNPLNYIHFIKSKIDIPPNNVN